MGSRRGGTLGRPFVDGAARPGGRALQKESVPERRRGQAPALHRWKHSKLGISFQGGRPHGAAPTARTGLGALARQTQAQMWNRTRPNFCKPRAQWPGRTRTQALLILRAGNVLPTARGNPRNGGPGERRIWTRSVHPEPSPGDPLVSFPSLGKKLAARRRRNSPAYNKCSPKPAPSSGPFGATFPPGGRLRKGRRRNFSAPIHLPITHSNIENKTTPERRYAP